MHATPDVAQGAQGTCPLLTAQELNAYFKPRSPQSHKGSYGTLVLICGSYGMVGAAMMAARAALRCGVGLVRLVVTAECYPIMAAALPEAVFTILEDADSANPLTLQLQQALCGASACVVGCGLGADAAQRLPAVIDALHRAPCPAVFDADALNYLSQHMDLLRKAATTTAPLIITPHPAEMARLTGKPTAEVQAARLQTATEFATAHGVYTVLKGAGTIIAAPDGSAKRNPTGNAGMAKGGSGDVLAGMMGALLAQGFAPQQAAEAAVYIHGAVGDTCAETLSQTAMLPTDMIDALPQYFRHLETQQHTHERSIL